MKIFLLMFIFCHSMVAMQDSKDIVVFHEDSPAQQHQDIIVNISNIVPKMSPDAKTDLRARFSRTTTASEPGGTKVKLAMIAACLSVIGSAVTLIIHFADC